MSIHNEERNDQSVAKCPKLKKEALLRFDISHGERDTLCNLRRNCGGSYDADDNGKNADIFISLSGREGERETETGGGGEGGQAQPDRQADKLRNREREGEGW